MQVFTLHVIYCVLSTKNSFMSGIIQQKKYFGQFLPAHLLICEIVNLNLAFAAYRKRD